MKKEYAYYTYLDKKIYLKGLQGLYYSWIRTNSKYDLIIICSGEISYKDILEYIPNKQIIIWEIPEYIIPAKNEDYSVKLDNMPDIILTAVYCQFQYSNIIGPMYPLSLTQYKSLLYLHCDVIVLDNLDTYIENTGKDGIEVASYMQVPGLDNYPMVHSTHFMIVHPDKEIFNSILNDMELIKTLNGITNIDAFINIYLIKNKHYNGISQYKDTKPSIESAMYQASGAFKYWTIFPNFSLEIFKSKDLIKDFTKMILVKTKKIKNLLIDGQINNSISKENTLVLENLKRYEERK